MLHKFLEIAHGDHNRTMVHQANEERFPLVLEGECSASIARQVLRHAQQGAFPEHVLNCDLAPSVRWHIFACLALTSPSIKCVFHRDPSLVLPFLCKTLQCLSHFASELDIDALAIAVGSMLRDA